MRTERRALIVHASRHGQTAKIANRIGDRLQEAGLRVSLYGVDVLPHDLDPGAFDAVVLGAPVRYGRHPKGARSFARERLSPLDAPVSGFYSVSGAASGETAEARQQAREYLDDFLEETGWSPDLRTVFAGAILFTRYDPITRWVIRKIGEREGRETDTSRDFEYTDWEEVDAFARDLVDRLRAPRREPFVPTSVPEAADG